MPQRRRESVAPDSEQRTEEGWLRRWSRRKQASHSRETRAAPDAPPAQAAASEVPSEETAPPALPPPLNALDEESDYSGFLHPRVGDALRRAALRQLFHSAKFNVVDGLDDYAEDYRSFEPLGDVLTADARHRMEQEAQRLRAQASAEGPSAHHEPAASADREPSRDEVPPTAPMHPAEEREHVHEPADDRPART